MRKIPLLHALPFALSLPAHHALFGRHAWQWVILSLSHMHTLRTRKEEGRKRRGRRRMGAHMWPLCPLHMTFTHSICALCPLPFVPFAIFIVPCAMPTTHFTHCLCLPPPFMHLAICPSIYLLDLVFLGLSKTCTHTLLLPLLFAFLGWDFSLSSAL